MQASSGSLSTASEIYSFHASPCLLVRTYAELMTGVLATVLRFHLHSEQLAFFPPLPLLIPDMPTQIDSVQARLEIWVDACMLRVSPDNLLTADERCMT